MAKTAFRVLTVILVALPTTAMAQVVYVEVSHVRGIQPYAMVPGMGGGIALADFDDDGDIDLFAPTNRGSPHQLYRNLGDGHFEEIAAAAGLASMESGRVALWFDYDADHRLDLIVATDCFQDPDPACLDGQAITLYRQVSDAVFVETTAAAGIGEDLVVSPEVHRGGMAAGDINNDGYLDLVVSLWGDRARLFLNDGDGTFTEISRPCGIGASPGGHWQPVMYDFDGDGLLDIYFAVDFAENRLWMNRGDQTFQDDAVPSGAANAWNDMGLTLGDHDNDGDPDVYITNITNETGRRNVLYRNDTLDDITQFFEIAMAAGVANTGWGWGTTFLDADNDTLLDLAATNGFSGGLAATDTSKLFMNAGGSPPTFTDESVSSGFNDTLWGSALAAMDHDRDGDLDLVQTTQALGATPSSIRLLENQGPPASNGYLVIQPRMTGPNHRAIGAVVRVTVGPVEMMRIITAGTSFLTQEPAEAVFGVGGAASVDRVVVEWPGGGETELLDVLVNQVLVVGRDTDTDGDGLPDATDADDDNDGIVDGADCFPTNEQIWGTPGEVRDLVFSQEPDTFLIWMPPVDPGGSWVPYDVVVSSKPGDFLTLATCLEANDATDRKAVDPIDPGLGEVRSYVVLVGGSCSTRTAGANSSDSPRSVRNCP